jgi:hypothetical protein
MNINILKNKIIVNKTDDKKFYSESLLMHEIKKELISMGLDVIKKLMYKDNHMVADTQQYIRARNAEFAIYDTEYSIRLLHQDFNENDSIILTKVNLN